MGAGVVPLSGMYAEALGQNSAVLISRMIPASTLGAVISAFSPLYMLLILVVVVCVSIGGYLLHGCRPPFRLHASFDYNPFGAGCEGRTVKRAKKAPAAESIPTAGTFYTNSQLKCLTERIRFFVLTKPSEVRRTGGTLNGTRQSQSEKDGARIKPF